MVVQHNISAMNNERMLNIASGNIKASTEKLSSGYRINRSADDAAGLSISEKMRRSIRGLTRASQNCEDGISLCNVSDGALDEVFSMLQRENQLVIQAANGTNSKTDRDYINNELEQISKEIDRIFETTKFNDIFLFRDENKSPHPIEVTKTYLVNTTTYVASRTKTKDIWMSTSIPANTDVETIITNPYTTEYKRVSTDIDYPNLNVVTTDTSTTTTTISSGRTVTTYQDMSLDPNYISLKTPYSVANSTGYISVRTNEQSLALSCGMTQFGVKIYEYSSATIPNNVENDLYGHSRNYNNVFTRDVNNPNVVKNVYSLGYGVSLTQTITRVTNASGVYNAYTINYQLSKADDGDAVANEESKLDLRLAFDTMNVENNSSLTSVNDGSMNFTIENDDAIVNVYGPAGATKGVLSSIDKLQNKWDFSTIAGGVRTGYHTGVGYLFEGITISEGATLDLGSVKYEITDLKKKPVRVTETFTGIDVVKEELNLKNTYYSLKGGTINVHAGDTSDRANKIYIDLPNLSTELLRIDYGNMVDAHKAEDSIDNISNALTMLSSIRSYFGAITNRLEHTIKNLDNVVENTTAAESRIRDTDMAEEMVKYSNTNIVVQAGQSMLSSANQTQQQVLTLLQ